MHVKTLNLEVGQHHSRSCRDFKRHLFQSASNLPDIFHYLTACGRLDTLPARAVVRGSKTKINRCILLRILVLIKLSILQSEDPARLRTHNWNLLGIRRPCARRGGVGYFNFLGCWRRFVLMVPLSFSLSFSFTLALSSSPPPSVPLPHGVLGRTDELQKTPS